MFVHIERGDDESIYECVSASAKRHDELLCIRMPSEKGMSVAEVAIDTSQPVRIRVYFVNNAGQIVRTVFSKDEDAAK